LPEPFLTLVSLFIIVPLPFTFLKQCLMEGKHIDMNPNLSSAIIYSKTLDTCITSLSPRFSIYIIG
jgi:hypothetical protein